MAKRKVVGEDGKTYYVKVKKPIYKRIWFWLLVLIVIGGIGGALGGGDNKEASKPSGEQTGAGNNSEAPKKEESTETESDLLQQYDAIKLGDLMAGAEGGSTIDEVKAVFGEPSSQTESTLQDVTTKMLSWSSLKGADFVNSLVVSFSNDKAASKAVTGLKVSDHAKATLDQFNAVATDGSYSIDTAKQTFGDPDGISETMINGAKQEMLTWTKNVEGDFGANFNITFDNGAATSKANYGMK